MFESELKRKHLEQSRQKVEINIASYMKTINEMEERKKGTAKTLISEVFHGLIIVLRDFCCSVMFVGISEHWLHLVIFCYDFCRECYPIITSCTYV